MTPEDTRVLEAIALSERTTPPHCLPLKRIATQALGGDSQRAMTVLVALEDRGFLRGNSVDLLSGWLTMKGRSCLPDQ